MGKKVLSTTFSELFSIIIGSTLLAFGISWFLNPLGLVTGGVSGIGIILEKLTKTGFAFVIPVWFTNMAINIPFFVISIKQRGFKFARNSLYSVVWTSIAIGIADKFPNPLPLGQDLFLGSIFGGVLVGAGVGMVLKINATTGGTDMMAAIFKFKRPGLPIEMILFVIDGIIIISGLFVFGVVNAMYAIISIVITTKVISIVLEGGRSSKAVFIVSDKYMDITEGVINKIERGATALDARGMYSNDQKKMLFVVVTNRELPMLRKIILDSDPTAFVTIAEVREVLGEGFIENYDPLSF